MLGAAVPSLIPPPHSVASNTHSAPLHSVTALFPATTKAETEGTGGATLLGRGDGEQRRNEWRHSDRGGAVVTGHWSWGWSLVSSDGGQWECWRHLLGSL